VDAPSVGLDEIVLHADATLKGEQQRDSVCAHLVTAVIWYVKTVQATLRQQRCIKVIQANALSGDDLACRLNDRE